MIDGIKISYPIYDLTEWKKASNIPLFLPTNVETGEAKEKKKKKEKDKETNYKTFVHTGEWEHYKLSLREVHKETEQGKKHLSHWLNIEGSLHKNHFGGANFAPFTWQDLQKELNHLEENLALNPYKCKFDNFETGVNLMFPYPVFDFLQKNLIGFKGHSFSKYEPDNNGIILGYHCNDLRQYAVKVYDKGLQNGLPYPLLRFELRYTKMEIVNKRGIYCLADLRSWDKVNSLLTLLLEAWDNIFLYDYDIDIDNLKPKERERLINGRNPKYWEREKQGNRDRYNYERKVFRRLVSKYGKDYHSLVREGIEKEWQTLMDSPIVSPTIQEQDLHKLTIKVKCQNVENRVSDPEVKQTIGNEFSEPIKKGERIAVKLQDLHTIKRHCLTCGRDISHQHPSSKYCSENRLGKAGKRCRNRGNNPRNNFNRKMQILKRRGLLFDIVPYFIKIPA